MKSLFLHSFVYVIILIIDSLSLSFSLSLSLPPSLPPSLLPAGFAHSPVVTAAALLEGVVGVVALVLALHHQQSFPSPLPPRQLRRSSTSRWPNTAMARRSYCNCSMRIPLDLQGCRTVVSSMALWQFFLQNHCCLD